MSKVKRHGKKITAGTGAKSGQISGRVKGRTNRKYKDTVFRMLFREKKALLELYNAVSGRSYKNSESLEIVTLESAVYMGIKNDLAFLVDMNLYLFEHQSTVNRNMPLRFLQYVSAEYEKLVILENLYHKKLVKIPAPHFVVFYNGTESYGERTELRLSDAFQSPESDPELELRVQVLNINKGFNESLKEACRMLKEYMQYVDKVRNYTKSMPIDEAVDRAVDECIMQGILKEFLLKNKAEVRRMSIFEYNEEAARRVIRDEAYEDGKAEGMAKSILRILEKKGSVPEKLKSEILKEKDIKVLEEWLDTAAVAKDIEEYMNIK